MVVTKLLDEAISCLSLASGKHPTTQDDLRCAVDDIKCSLVTQTQQPYLHPSPQSYADVTRGLPTAFCPLSVKPTASAKAQEKEIFISLKNANKASSFISTLVTTLTNKFNEMLSEFFKDPANGGLDIPAPVQSI